MAERGRQGGQELLEAQPLGERELHPLALQGAGEGLAEEAEPLHQLVRPGVFVANGAEGEHAEHGSPGAQGEQHLRARAHALEAGPIDRRRLRKLVESRESDDLPAPQSLRHPGELVGGHDARRLLEARPRPREAEPRPAFGVLVETASIHAQERDDLLECALDRRVDIAGARRESTRRTAPRGASRTAGGPPAGASSTGPSAGEPNRGASPQLSLGAQAPGFGFWRHSR